MQHLGFSTTLLRKRILTLAISGAVLLTGCEKMENSGRSADREVDKHLAEANANANGIGSKAQEQSIKNVLDASKVSGVSDAGKARAMSALSQSEYAQAMALWPEVEGNSQKLSQSLWELRAAAMEMRRIEQSAGYYGQLDPKDALAKLDEIRTQVQGQLDKANADLAGAKTDLDNRKKEIADLTTQRQELLKQASDLNTQSIAAKGQQGVDLFKQSADISTKAGNLAAQIDAKNAGLLPVQHKIDMAQQQIALLSGTNGTLPQMDSQKTQLSAAWDSSKQHGQEISADVKKLFDSVVAPNTDKAAPNAGANIQTTADANEKLNNKIETLLTDAISHADAAAKAATSYHRSLQQEAGTLAPTSPRQGAIKQEMGAYDEQQYQLLKGNAQLALANFYASRAVIAAEQKGTIDALGDALKTAGIDVPKELPNADAATAHTKADQMFVAAEDTLQKVATSNSNADGFKSIRNGGLSSLVWARYGHLQLTPDATEMNALKLNIDSAKENQLAVPTLQ